MTAPLSGLRVVEFAGLAPGPMLGLTLADWGADVIRLDRPDKSRSDADVLCRGKRSISVSTKDPKGLEIIKKLIQKADVVIDPFRPGVLERSGLDPKDLIKNLNPRLIVVRITGWRREGEWSARAGHDLNYLALTGVLSLLKPPTSEVPIPPGNLLADFAGGAIMGVVGVLMALVERNRSGKGQVVESNMMSGLRYVATFPLIRHAGPLSDHIWNKPVGENFLDGGAPFYGVYKCKDGKFFTVACLEPEFYAFFMNAMQKQVKPSAGEDFGDLSQQNNRDKWPAMRKYLLRAFLQKSRDEWTPVFKDIDACAAPVFDQHEALDNPASGLGELDRDISPHPLLSRTPGLRRGKHDKILQSGEHTLEILQELGISQEQASSLQKSKAIGINRQSKM